MQLGASSMHRLGTCGLLNSHVNPTTISSGDLVYALIIIIITIHLLFRLSALQQNSD